MDVTWRYGCPRANTALLVSAAAQTEGQRSLSESPDRPGAQIIRIGGDVAVAATLLARVPGGGMARRQGPGGVTPSDFRAVAQVRRDEAWHLVMATGPCHADGLAGVAVGRDACDMAFIDRQAPSELAEQAVTIRRIG